MKHTVAGAGNSGIRGIPVPGIIHNSHEVASAVYRTFGLPVLVITVLTKLILRPEPVARLSGLVEFRTAC